MVYWTSFLFFGTWHNIRQHYGFLRLYRARTPQMDRQAAKAEILCLYGGTSAAFFTNIHFGWLYESFGPNVTWIQVPFAVLVSVFLVFLYGLFGTLKVFGSAGKPGSLSVLHDCFISFSCCPTSSWVYWF